MSAIFKPRYLLAYATMMLLSLPAFKARAADPAPNLPAPIVQTLPPAATVTPPPAPVPAAAKPTTYAYAPPNCDFRMDFPEAPAIGKRCDPDDPSHCSKVTSFTHVFDLDASVNFTMTCNPADKSMYDRYSGDVMRATLDSMVGKGKLDNYQTGFKQFDDAKQATIVGTGKSGVSDKIYVAQLWIGHASVFMVEGELVGNEKTDADDMFATILRSIRYKDWKLTAAGPVPNGADAAKSADAAAAATPPAAAPATPPVTQVPANPPAAYSMSGGGQPGAGIPGAGLHSVAPAFAPATSTLIVTPVPPESSTDTP